MFTDEEKIKLHDPLLNYNDKIAILEGVIDRMGRIVDKHEDKLAPKKK